MKLVYFFSFCLIAGIAFSQFFDLSSVRPFFTFLADTILAYILMEVGLELILDKKHWKNYLWDYVIASTAAGLPWIFCFVYLLFRTEQSWQETLLISRFAAPTATGILFSMLAAAGLGATWLFRKVRVLAIFDDIDTILFMIPLQFLLMGMRYQLFIVFIVVIVLIALAWRYLHQLRLPSGRPWLFFYAIVLAALLRVIEIHFHLKIEILLPAFVWGTLLYNPHDPHRIKIHFHEHAYLEPERKPFFIFDRGIKAAFMVLVGLLLPKLQIQTRHISTLIMDVLLLSLFLILGKCFPIFCYRKEASLKERFGVAVSMCPRGELGAGILVLAIESGAVGYATTISGLSLALNFLITGAFVSVAIQLAKEKKQT